MSSVSQITQCPVCGFFACDDEYNCRTQEHSVFCTVCGYSYGCMLQRDEFGNVAFDTEKINLRDNFVFDGKIDYGLDLCDENFESIQRILPDTAEAQIESVLRSTIDDVHCIFVKNANGTIRRLLYHMTRLKVQDGILFVMTPKFEVNESGGFGTLTAVRENSHCEYIVPLKEGDTIASVLGTIRGRKHKKSAKIILFKEKSGEPELYNVTRGELDELSHVYGQFA